MKKLKQKSAIYMILYSQFWLFPKAFAIGMMVGSIGIILAPFIGTEWTQKYMDMLEV